MGLYKGFSEIIPLDQQMGLIFHKTVTLPETSLCWVWAMESQDSNYPQTFGYCKKLGS